jgi:hypothetical protein
VDSGRLRHHRAEVCVPTDDFEPMDLPEHLRRYYRTVWNEHRRGPDDRCRACPSTPHRRWPCDLAYGAWLMLTVSGTPLPDP